MRKVKAIIERAGDGSYSVYMDADDMSYLITGTGKNAEEAINSFKTNYDYLKKYRTLKISTEIIGIIGDTVSQTFSKILQETIKSVL